jgi:hypothetical protein
MRGRNPQGMTVEELRSHIWRLGGEHNLAEGIGRSVFSVRAWVRGKSNVHPRVATLIRALPDGPTPALTHSEFQWAVQERGGSHVVARQYFFPDSDVLRWLRGDAVPPDCLLQELRDACFVTVSP